MRNALAGPPVEPMAEEKFLVATALDRDDPNAREVVESESFVMPDNSRWYLVAGDLVDARDPKVLRAVKAGLRLRKPS